MRRKLRQAVIFPTSAALEAGVSALVSGADDLFGNGSAGLLRAESLVISVYQAIVAVDRRAFSNPEAKRLSPARNAKVR